MTPIFTDPILPALAIAFWVALTALARLAAGRLLACASRLPIQARLRLAAARRGVRQLEDRGWSGRHGLPGALVAAVKNGICRVPELETIAPRPAVEDVAMTVETTALSEDEQREVDAMHAIVEEYREEHRVEAAQDPAPDAAAESWEQTMARLDASWDELAASRRASWDVIAADLDSRFEAIIAGVRTGTLVEAVPA